LLASLFASGRVVDLILAVMAGEFLWLVWRGGPAGRGSRALDLVLALGPGALIALALRCALTGLAWPWIAAFLTLSLPLHLADLRRRRF
jgi:hypothetical protein